jgi:hypothetical protein
MLFCKYVFSLFNVEKDRSLLAVATGRVAKICKSLKVEKKIDMLHFFRASKAFFSKSLVLVNCCYQILISLTAVNTLQS